MKGTMGDSLISDEASILKNFFNVQSDKHGPELLRRLNTKLDKPEVTVCLEKRPQVKIELEVEQVIKQEIEEQELMSHRNISPGSDSSSNSLDKDIVPYNTSSGNHHVAVSFGNANTPCLVAPNGMMVQFPPLLDNEWGMLPAFLNGGSMAQLSQQEHLLQKRGVSVIQRAPPRNDQSSIMFLEKRRSSPTDMSFFIREEEGLPSKEDTQQVVSSESDHMLQKDMGMTKHFLKRKLEVSGDENDEEEIMLKVIRSEDLCEKKRSNQQQSDHLICEVCGEKAGKHSYYGGQVCPSCRAFFRRSVQSRYNETFKCAKGKEDCEISLVTRKNCQYCRYQSCLSAGMRPSWILSDEERLRRFHGRASCTKRKGRQQQQSPLSPGSPGWDQFQREKARSRQQNNLMCAVDSPSTHPNPYVALSPEDHLTILRYGEVMKRSCTSPHQDLEPQLLTDILQVTLHSTSLSYQTAVQLHNILENRTRSCFTLFHEFQALPPGDQFQVVEHNTPLVHRFRQAVCLTNPRLSWSGLVKIFVGEEKLREVENVPHDLSAKQTEKKPFDYQDLFTAPWRIQSKEVTQMHETLVNEIANSVEFEDEIQMVLIVLIIAFNPDFLDLKDRHGLERTQFKFVLLLQAHLSSHNPPHIAAVKLAKALMVPAIARQLHQLTKERLVI